MATITLEIGKKGKKKERSVSFLICQGKTKKRIPTEVTVTDADLTSNQKKIKNIEKARIIEELRRTYQDRLYALSLEIACSNMDATAIASRLTTKREDLDFFRICRRMDDTHLNKISYKLQNDAKFSCRVYWEAVTAVFLHQLFFT